MGAACKREPASFVYKSTPFHGIHLNGKLSDRLLIVYSFIVLTGQSMSRIKKLFKRYAVKSNSPSPLCVPTRKACSVTGLLHSLPKLCFVCPSVRACLLLNRWWHIPPSAPRTLLSPLGKSVVQLIPYQSLPGATLVSVRAAGHCAAENLRHPASFV